MRKSKLRDAGEFFALIRAKRQSWYLAMEGLLTSGLYWHMKARMCERTLARKTSGVFEASGDEFEELCDEWEEQRERAIYGKPLSLVKKLGILKLEDNGLSTSQIRTWNINGHLNKKGELAPHYRGKTDTYVETLGWTWHVIVGASATLFLILTWSLPGPLWKKIVATIIELVFFAVMSTLMNSTSLSALPPRKFH